MSVFIKNLNNNDLIKTDNKYWKFVNGQKFFKLKTFTEAETTVIKNGVKDKSNFIFDDNGNVSYQNIKWMNPMVVNNIFDEQMTLERIKTLGESTNYELGKNMILSRNLKFILYFKDKNAYILYNPIHRNYFRNYYNNIPLEQLGLDGRTSIGEHKLDPLFRSYCSSMKDDDIFVDPTCLCIESPLTCQQNAIFKTNVANFPEISAKNKGKLSDIGNCCSTFSPGCGYGSSLEASDSFITKFMQNIRNANSGCPTNFNYTDCSIVLDIAGDAKLAQTQFAQECGIGRGTGDTDTSPELVIDSAKGESNLDGSLVGAPTQGREDTTDTINIRDDLPGVSNSTINPTLSDNSPVVLTPSDLSSNENPNPGLPAGGTIQEVDRSELIPLPSRGIDEDVLLDEMNKNTTSTPTTPENPLLTFFNQNKLLSIGIIFVLVVLILIILFFLFILSNKKSVN